MPQGPGTYGTQRGRPPKKESALKQSGDIHRYGTSPRVKKPPTSHMSPFDKRSGFKLRSGNSPILSGFFLGSSSGWGTMAGLARISPKSPHVTGTSTEGKYTGLVDFWKQETAPHKRQKRRQDIKEWFKKTFKKK